MIFPISDACTTSWPTTSRPTTSWPITSWRTTSWHTTGRLAALALITLVAAGCGGAPNEDPRVLAQVGDEVITVAEFEQEMALRARQRPGYYAEFDKREQLLEDMIQWRVLVAEARRAGMDQDPELRRMIERLLVQRLREERVSDELASVAVSDDEVAAFYQAHQEEFSRPARIQGAIIHVAVAGDAPEAAREAARERIQAALEAAGGLAPEILHFGPVAVEFSEDAVSRYQGGVIGWLVDRAERSYRWDAAVIEALFALRNPGEIGPVVVADDGFYLVRLVAREAAESRPLAQVADGIRHRLTRERRAEIEAGVLENATSRQDVRINHTALRVVEPPETGPVPERAEPRPPALPGGAPAAVDADGV